MGLFGKALEIEIIVEGGGAVVYPGDMLRGVVKLEVKKNLKFEEIRLEMNSIEKFKVKVEEIGVDENGMETTSTHTKTEMSKDTWAQLSLVPAGELDKGYKGQYPFEFNIPEDVFGTHKGGSLASLDWELRVVVDRKMAVDVNEELEIIIGTLVAEEWFEPAEVGESNEPDQADMYFILPKRACLLGETITGELIVSPKDEIKVSEVRVELAHYEYSPIDPQQVMGTYGYTYDQTALMVEFTQTVVEVELSGKEKLQPGQEYRFPFELMVPSEAPLSGGSPNSACNWSLHGILNRSMRKDTAVAVDVQIVN